MNNRGETTDMDGARHAAAWRRIPADARVVVGPCLTAGAARALLRAFPQVRRFILLCGDPVPPGLLEMARGAAGQVRLVSGGDARTLENNLDTALEREALYFAEGRVGLLSSGSVGLDFGAWEARTLDFTRSVVGSVAFRATRGWHLLANTLMNIERAAVSSGLGCLAGAASGRAVVVVGAGPSLDLTAAELAGRADVVIVACDAAWATLRVHGVRPDFVVTCDDVEDVWRFFARVPPESRDTPVVLPITACWALARYWPGPLFFSASGRERNEAGRLLGLPRLDMGACVGHAAYELAVLLGGSPIILTGFDLAYRDDRFHPAVSDNPYFDADEPTAQANLLEVEGVDGRPVKTEQSMYLYLREFERRFQAASVPVWDATEGGARKRGTRVVPLRGALEEVRDVSSKLCVMQKTPGAGASEAVRDWKEGLPADVSAFLGEAGRVLLETGSGAVAGGDSPFTRLDRHGVVMSLLAEVDHAFLQARALFEWEDCQANRALAGGGGRNDCAGSVAAYVDYLAGFAGIIPLLARFPLRGKRGGGGLLFGSADDLRAAVPLVEEMTRGGVECRSCEGDAADFAAIWSQLEQSDAGWVLSVNGSLFPAVWALPGLACLDWRTSPPPLGAERHNWLPGYAVVCPDEQTGRSWRAKLPGDRPVFVVYGNGLQRVAEGAGGILAWKEVILAMKCTRAFDL